MPGRNLVLTYWLLPYIQPVSIVSYNHLGNNDGKNLSAPKQFRSKEVSVSLSFKKRQCLELFTYHVRSPRVMLWMIW